METLALIKRVPQLDATAPMASQLQMLNLFGDEDTPYESLHAVVSLAVKPWFDAFVGTRPGVKDSDSKIGKDNNPSFNLWLIFYQESPTRRRNLRNWNSHCSISNKMWKFLKRI